MATKKSSSKPPKGKRGRKDKAGAGTPEVIRLSVAGHPRASKQVRLAKGFGGLAGFAAAAYLSLNAGVPLFQTGVRALACGIVAYLLAWACSVSLWRQLMLAELKAHQEHIAELAAKQAPPTLPLPDGAVAAAPVASPAGQ